ncbi:unnamed protein product [Lepeophtheirus salmonis]|uniref:(salmon louse) hypothetical protein n=1 Tax=Lepeophtheirus salmonis TaxID=72036 RepID=A0A7R8CPY5_LEPSM|nr:unnamed protein product [Lepeophtheirus salmonis]CAF2890306.1 unnamed protein product [Lepeophtheirus salmonis]
MLDSNYSNAEESFQQSLLSFSAQNFFFPLKLCESIKFKNRAKILRREKILLIRKKSCCCCSTRNTEKEEKENFKGVGAALVLGYPRRPSRGHRIHTDFDGDVNNFIMTEEIIHPKDNHLDSIEGHDIILAKVSDLRSSFNNRFPRDHSGGQQYRYNLEEVPESFWRTLTYADRNTDERKIQDIFNGMDINRDSKADPWELHDWIIVVQEAVQSSVHQRQWEQFRKDENDTITWTDYIYQVNPTGYCKKNTEQL